MIYGIDISEHQTRRGMPDFAKVKASGKDFVLIRVGWGGYEGYIDYDEKLSDVINSAISVGLNVGLYVYSYNKNPNSAIITAQQICKFASNFKITFPIFYDVEEYNDKCLLNQGREGLTDTVIAFLDEVEKQGYYAMWYTYSAFIKQYLNYERLKKYDLWLANYSANKPDYSCGIWQNTVLGKENKNGARYFVYGQQEGIIGNCDMNICYRDYPNIIETNGLNGFKKQEEVAEPPKVEVDYKALYERYKLFSDSVIKLANDFQIK